MKIVLILYIAVVSVCLCACGMNGTDNNTMSLNDNYNHQNTINNEELIKTEITATDGEESKQTSKIVPISDKSITIPYQGDLYIRSIVSVDDLIFLSGLEPSSGNYAIHKMKIEDEVSERLPIDIPEKMTVQGINVDKDGNLHIFFTDSDRSIKRCEMWVSDQDGNVIRKIDMKKAFLLEGSALTEFVIDGEGRYYISGARVQDRSKSGITVLDADGNILGLVDSPNSGLWGLQSIARGNDGMIYVVYYTRDGEMAVMSIDPEALCIGDCYEGVLPSGHGAYVRVRAGINADLLVFGDAGIYSYSLGDESGKQLVDGSSFLFSTESGLCHDFLSDGRFLFVDGDHLLYNVDDLWYSGEMYQNIMFYYLPVTLSAESEE